MTLSLRYRLRAYLASHSILYILIASEWRGFILSLFLNESIMIQRSRFFKPKDTNSQKTCQDRNVNGKRVFASKQKFDYNRNHPRGREVRYEEETKARSPIFL